MFRAVWNHLKNVLLADVTKSCDLEKQSMEQDSFRSVKMTSYIPNAAMLEKLNEKVKTVEEKQNEEENVKGWNYRQRD